MSDAVCLIVFLAMNGTLLPRPGFDAALSSIVPPLVAIAIHVSAVIWDWDAVIRQVGAMLVR